ncbi:MAG: S9 family peptidase [Bacteroidetes bacterium 43-16]|nr:MAG: S9 family peptidase [Bacteroidetes bacterium 43-16]
MKKVYSLLLLGLSIASYAQENIGYQVPSKEIYQLADYARAPSINMDTKKDYMLFTYRNTYKSLEDLNLEELRLAGLRVNVKTNISATASYINNLKLRKVADVKAEPVQVKGLPANPKIANIGWSYDEKKIAFTHTTDKGVELWVLDIATATAKRLTADNLNANMGYPYTWYKDNQHLLVKVIPAKRPALINAKDDLPKGPIVSVAEGKTSQNRTYADLLKNKTDEQNFETIISAELYTVDLGGNSKLFLGKGMYAGESFSPDGKYIMVSTIKRPFSYIVPLSRFPNETNIYDLDAKLLKQVNEVPLVEIMPKGFSSVRTGKRSLSWRDDKPATLFYVSALDGGDQANKVPYRDELFLWDAPFEAAPRSMGKTVQRFGGISWGNEQVALVYDQWYDTRNLKTYLFDPSGNNEQPKTISDRNYQDVYSDPGTPEARRNIYGRDVLAIENNNLYLVGEGHTPKGQFPFIDELNLKTLKTKRLYQSNLKDKKEEILSIEDFKKGLALVQIQSATEYPNYYFRNFKKSGAVQQLTFNANPFESIKGVYKEVIKYKRADGVELSGTLYLPAGYDRTKKEKLPLLIWAYPQEFKDKNSAGQSTQNPNEFTFPYYGSFVYWVTKGYAVLDDASFPIIGEGDKEPNDDFINQLVANGKAAIDAVDALGYIDRSRVGVGGHSYGAFMTANLLTHCDLFACGIARSGAYNRTLTPFGFQSEQRNFWDVPAIYSGMSPFNTADKMKKPILLVHGEADNNPGTFTLQTERYFQALKGLGANARMVILPKESHSYVARENIMHLLWEQEQFLDKYLKPAQQ